MNVTRVKIVRTAPKSKDRSGPTVAVEELMATWNLTAEGCHSRRARLWQNVPDDLQVLIMADPTHLIYLANFATSPFVFRVNDASAFLVLTRDRSYLVADSMLKMFLDQVHVDEVIAPAWYDGQHAAPHRQNHLIQTCLQAVESIAGSRLGIESGSVPFGLVEGMASRHADLSVVDIGPTIRTMRRAKDPDELALIRASIRAGEAGHRAALEQIRPGMTELQAYGIIQQACFTELGTQARVYGDFASGERTHTKGGPATDRTIAAGEPFLLDYSVVVQGYRGDFTNTFLVEAEPTPRQRDLYQACLDALAAGEAQLRPGASARSVHKATVGSFQDQGLAEFFLTHTGHGIGLSHPEPPYFVPNSDETLVVGDVVTIEPGLYLGGEIGIRIERNYLITETGFENLTHHDLTMKQP